jgi:integrase
MHAACAAQALAAFPSQGQEEKEVCQGKIHSHPGEAGVENQRQNTRAERPASRPSLSKQNGKPDGHFLRKLKAIGKKAGVEEAEFRRFRKTYADTVHEEGVSVNTIRIRLGHESLDVTLAYLKGKDAESEEAQEHANTSNPARYA